MSQNNPSLSGRRSIDYTATAKQDSSAADGPFSPAGLKVLVVDDDPMCLKVVSAMLKRCNYEVVTQSNGQEALEMLRLRQEEGIDQFDLVLSDVYMPDMDGFRLLEAIGLELDLPVIMMSSDGDTNVVLRGVTHGAVDFLIKPVRIEELRNVWQHVVRRRSVQISRNGEDSAVDYDGDSRTHGTKRKETDTLRAEHESASGSKKARVVWSVEMHQQFVSAVNILGIDKAVPKRILDLMNVEGLTRENVASHLQKYRLYLKRVEGVHNGKGGRVPKPPVVERLAAAVDGSDGGMSFNGQQQTMSHNNSPLMQQSLGVQQQQQQHQQSMTQQPTQSAQHAQQAVPMSMMASGYSPPAMMGIAGPMAAAHMAAAWQQQQTMAMQAAAAAAAASGALPGPAMPAMHHPYMPAPTPMLTSGYHHPNTMQHPSMSTPYCPPQPPATTTAPPSTHAAQPMPPVSGAMNSNYPGSHGSIATLPYQHTASGTAAGAVTNGGGALKHNNGCSSTEDPPSRSQSQLHATPLSDDVVPVDHYPSNEDDALLPSLGGGGAMPEDEPLSESLLHDLPPIKHDGDQEFFNIFNIQQSGDRAAAGP